MMMAKISFRCILKLFFGAGLQLSLKLGEPDTLNKACESMTMIEKISIIILVMLNCYIGNSTAIHTAMY